MERVNQDLFTREGIQEGMLSGQSRLGSGRRYKRWGLSFRWIGRDFAKWLAFQKSPHIGGRRCWSEGGVLPHEPLLLYWGKGPASGTHQAVNTHAASIPWGGGGTDDLCWKSCEGPLDLTTPNGPLSMTGCPQFLPIPNAWYFPNMPRSKRGIILCLFWNNPLLCPTSQGLLTLPYDPLPFSSVKVLCVNLGFVNPLFPMGVCLYFPCAISVLYFLNVVHWFPDPPPAHTHLSSPRSR